MTWKIDNIWPDKLNKGDIDDMIFGDSHSDQTHSER